MALAVADGREVRVVEAPEPDDAIGINDRVALSVAEERMRRRIVEDHLRNGVTIVDPASTRIDADVEIGQDARIEPWTILEGSTVIAQDAVIGPNAHLRDSRIGPRTRVWASVIEESTVAEDVEIGPFAHLRPGLRDRRALPHRQLRRDQEEPSRGRHAAAPLQLPRRRRDRGGRERRGRLGDRQLRRGRQAPDRHRRRVSLGVDTMMVAPVTIGRGATTGAGAVVTRDVAPGKKVVGVPARPIELKRRRTKPADAGDPAPPKAPVPSGADRNP